MVSKMLLMTMFKTSMVLELLGSEVTRQNINIITDHYSLGEMWLIGNVVSCDNVTVGTVESFRPMMIYLFNQRGFIKINSVHCIFISKY